MPTIPTDWPGLKAMGGELFRAIPTLDEAGLDNGFKAFGLAYLGCTFADDFMGRLARDVEAPALMRLMMKAYLKRDLELVAAREHPRWHERKDIPNGHLPYTRIESDQFYRHDGMLCNADCTRSVFDDVDE